MRLLVEHLHSMEGLGLFLQHQRAGRGAGEGRRNKELGEIYAC